MNSKLAICIHIANKEDRRTKRKKITATVLKRNVKKMWFVSVLFRLESWESHELQSITYVLAMKFHTEKTASAERLNYNHYNEEKRGKLRRCSNRNSNYYVFGVAFICLGSTKAKQKKNNQNRRREAKKKHWYIIGVACAPLPTVFHFILLMLGVQHFPLGQHAAAIVFYKRPISHIQ